MKPLFIIITGHPATGKTTLAHALGNVMKFPVFSKDEVKEDLFNVLGWSDKDWSRKLSLAAYRILDRAIVEALSTGTGIIVESNFLEPFDSTRFQGFIDRFCPRAVQILLSCDEEVRIQRFQERIASGVRHPGHHELDQLPVYQSKDPCVPLSLSSPTITIDTTNFNLVDIDEIRKRINVALQ